MNAYEKLKNSQQERFNAFPMMFAFSEKQFAEGMAKLGLTANDTDKIYSAGAGGYYKKEDAPALHALIEDFDREMTEAIAGDTTGDGFIYDMFLSELCNHEYGYTGESEETLDSLGLTYEQVEADSRLKHGFDKARRVILKEGDIF